MTREDTKKYFSTTIDGLKKATSLTNVIDTLFDDLETRTCGNCKHSRLGEEYLGECYYCSLGVEYQGSDVLDADFGCNKFEREQD